MGARGLGCRPWLHVALSRAHTLPQQHCPPGRKMGPVVPDHRPPPLLSSASPLNLTLACSVASLTPSPESGAQEASTISTKRGTDERQVVHPQHGTLAIQSSDVPPPATARMNRATTMLSVSLSLSQKVTYAGFH